MEERDLKKEEKLARKKRLAYGKRILAQALNGFYYFDDDEVENFIDKMDLKFGTNRRSRRMITGAVLGNQKVRDKICDVGTYIFGEV